jgi:hypothetical protein
VDESKVALVSPANRSMRCGVTNIQLVPQTFSARGYRLIG